MTDTILKQNAGRGGAAMVIGTTQQIPAGQYDRVEFLAATTFPTIPTQAERPLLANGGWLTTTSFPANSSIKTPFVIGAGSLARVTGAAIFYKAL